MKSFKSVKEINAEINKIFCDYNITAPLGDEDFWNKVDKVKEKDSVVGARLRRLAYMWEKAFKRENN